MQNSNSIKQQVDKLIKKSSRSNFTEDFSGKIPPQAIELEEAVLGALMLEKDVLNKGIDQLRPEVFYVDAHQRIFSAIQQLFEKGKPVDILTVTDQLRQNGELELIGGAYYITELSNKVASAAHVEYHAKIISQKFIQRELIKVSSDIIKEAYEDTTDALELLDKAEKNLFSIADSNLKRNYEGMHTLVGKAIKQIEIRKNHKDNLTGIGSGFVELDRITSGWQKSDLIIIAARPGMGKTSFIVTAARNAAVIFKKPVAIFSLEMSVLQLVNRLISGETELAVEKLKRGDLAPYEWQQLNTKITSLSEAPIFIDDSPAINIFELRAKCRRLKASHNIELIVIDYLQLMSGTGDKHGNREQEISNISRSLKSIAKELDIPIIALSQLSRAVETRGGTKRPQLSDLRESGAIEQDADLVTFIYRPEYYDITEDENGNSVKGIAELIIAKHRNGSLDKIPMRFIDKYAKFVDLETNELSGDMPNEEKQPDVTITKSSRMNDMDEEENKDNPPF